MDGWISVKQQLPDNEEWVQVMTQDGTTYPAIYRQNTKVWSPVFRGGEVAQLMHGNVLYWQPHAEPYTMETCECGRSFLKTPATQSCPICSAFRGVIAPQEIASEPDVTKPKPNRGGRRGKAE